MCAHNYDGDVLTDEIAQVWSGLSAVVGLRNETATVPTNATNAVLTASAAKGKAVVWHGMAWHGSNAACLRVLTVGHSTAAHRIAQCVFDGLLLLHTESSLT